jgi:protein TonB
MGGRGRLGFRSQEALSPSAPEICVNFANAGAAPKVDVSWIPAWAPEGSGSAAAPGGFDIAAIRPRLVQSPPTSEASARAGGSLGAVISAGLHGAALAALLTWATPVAEPPSPEVVTVEIVADAPTPTVREAQPPSEPAAPPPVAEAPPPIAKPPIAGPTPPPAAETSPPVEPSPPPIAQTPPPFPEAAPPPIAETPPPVVEPAPPPVAQTAPVPEPAPPPPVAETRPPVAEPAPPPVVQTPPPIVERLPVTKPSPRPPAMTSPPLRPTPTASPAPRRVQTLPAPAKERPEPRHTRRESATDDSGPTQSTSAPTKAFAHAISSEEAEAYQGVVLGRIAAQKHYPEAARERAPHGVAIVRFSIGASGQLAGASLAQSAGDPILDAEALATVRRASPFPPPPAGAPRSFSAPLSYRIR